MGDSVITSEWFGAYADSWQGEITDESFCHPAKYSRGLIARIYDHMLSMGYIEPGNIIGDPFGGVALGAIHAMLKGMDWRGVELEQKFVELGNQNLALWRGKYGDLLRGTAVLVQGDSREFLRHVAGIDGVVSSAPFIQATGGSGEASRNAIDPKLFDRHRAGQANSTHAYGQTPGQLGAMKEGDLDAIVTSPVYADVINSDTSGIDWEKAGRPDRLKPSDKRKNPMTDGKLEYGRTAGNLGGLDAVVSSAPFESSLTDDFPRSLDGKDNSAVATFKRTGKWARRREHGEDYGSTSGNIGNDSADTFWQAAAVIVAQTYAALKPGAYAAWVCGDYVRQGERVYFGRQWLELCESVGYEPVEHIVAWKREPGPTQLGLIGDDKDLSIDRVSFFRRLANQKNPAAAILNEDIYIVRKPLQETQP